MVNPNGNNNNNYLLSLQVGLRHVVIITARVISLLFIAYTHSAPRRTCDFDSRQKQSDSEMTRHAIIIISYIKNNKKKKTVIQFRDSHACKTRQIIRIVHDWTEELCARVTLVRWSLYTARNRRRRRRRLSSVEVFTFSKRQIIELFPSRHSDRSLILLDDVERTYLPQKFFRFCRTVIFHFQLKSVFDIIIDVVAIQIRKYRIDFELSPNTYNDILQA